MSLLQLCVLNLGPLQVTVTNALSGATIKTVTFKYQPEEVQFASGAGIATADAHLDQLVSVNVGKRTLYLFEVCTTFLHTIFVRGFILAVPQANIA